MKWLEAFAVFIAIVIMSWIMEMAISDHDYLQIIKSRIEALERRK